MGHSLWLSEDSLYTLGFRMGKRSVDEEAARAETTTPLVGRVEMDHIHNLMLKVARQIEGFREQGRMA